MCGIAGAFHYARSAPVSEKTLRAMAECIVHRGPDDEGFHLDPEGKVGLAFRRLSIVDLSGGHQPMSDEDGRYHLVFNGEIYNHLEIRRELEARGRRFRTRSDTEVILAAYREYGPDCVERFQGMFAFAVWDRDEKRLFLARDRVGIKPLYYADTGGAFVFGSEIKSLFRHPDLSPELDRDELAMVGMEYKIKLLFPPSMWEPLPYRMNGRDYEQFTAITMRFAGALERETGRGFTAFDHGQREVPQLEPLGGPDRRSFDGEGRGHLEMRAADFIVSFDPDLTIARRHVRLQLHRIGAVHGAAVGLLLDAPRPGGVQELSPGVRRHRFDIEPHSRTGITGEIFDAVFDVDHVAAVIRRVRAHGAAFPCHEVKPGHLQLTRTLDTGPELRTRDRSGGTGGLRRTGRRRCRSSLSGLSGARAGRRSRFNIHLFPHL